MFDDEKAQSLWLEKTRSFPKRQMERLSVPEVRQVDPGLFDNIDNPIETKTPSEITQPVHRLPQPTRMQRRIGSNLHPMNDFGPAANELRGGEMSFLDHLDELRKRLVNSIGFIVLAFGVCWFLSGYIYNFLLDSDPPCSLRSLASRNSC